MSDPTNPAPQPGPPAPAPVAPVPNPAVAPPQRGAIPAAPVVVEQKPNVVTTLDKAGQVWFNELRQKAQSAMAALTEEQRKERGMAVAAVTALVEPNLEANQQHVFDLENWLVELLPDADLKQWVASVREDFRATFGSDALQAIQGSLVPQVATGQRPDLMAEARRLQQELHFQSSVQPWAQEKREDLVWAIVWAFVIVGAFALGFASLGWIPSFGGKLQFVGIIALMGALGAFLSCLQRVQVANLATSHAMAAARHGKGELAFRLSPVEGACFAPILTLVLVAGLMPEGFIIPSVSLQSCDSTEGQIALSFFSMKLCFGAGKDIAILLLWSFLAGFSERLVPDLLTRIAAKGKG